MLGSDAARIAALFMERADFGKSSEYLVSRPVTTISIMNSTS